MCEASSRDDVKTDLSPTSEITVVIRRKALQISVAVTAVMAVYCALFFALRTCVFATDYDDNGIAIRTTRLCYFSENRAANSILFYVFLPIHSCVGRPYYSRTFTKQAFEAYDGWPYYLADKSALGRDGSVPAD
jgi:hypothetical protein